jgi:hypothetical protein
MRPPNKPRIYADFQKLDGRGRAVLTCRGTTEDLKKLGIELQEGLNVILYSDDLDARGNPDDLEVEAVVEFDRDDACWVARFDAGGFRHASDMAQLSGDGEDDCQEGA